MAGELDSGQQFPINPWLIAITVTLATFMELLDTSIANVSLPHIAGGLATSYEESTWVLTSYLVANAIVLPLSAWLSRVFGRKRYYMGCVALFRVSSLLCGLAPNLSMLIFFRVLQGIGGWIIDSFSWRWVFFINLPIGIISLFVTSRVVSDPPQFKKEVEEARSAGKLRIDYIGIALIAIAFACLEIVLDRGQQDDWLESPFIVRYLAAGVIALVVGCVWEFNQPDPVMAFDRTRLIRSLHSVEERVSILLHPILPHLTTYRHVPIAAAQASSR